MTTNKTGPMKLKMFACEIGLAVVALTISFAPTQAQVPLSSYMDSKGFIDVQALTCAQLANTYQEDADYLAAWYSGWYNGLAQKHFAHVTRAKSGEHQVIVYCKAHPELKVIQAIDVLFKNEK
ncbi:HdeA/HdeB family chaperone [Bradyrhizobium sp. ma5]|uniref:HdeA/HdeB family chaperone n=1 Tax=Bradyrhizobium sp. ma5 TaxID=3344828 RepID=UPI0035D49C46